MDFRTIVDIPKAQLTIPPCEQMLFVGSCFADHIGRMFQEDKFRATVNPYGVMYNPVSIVHTVERWLADKPHEVPHVAVFTLGTNHVYVLNETGEIVDNCQKRPQRLFTERELSVAECRDALRQAVRLLRQACPSVEVIVTVSPIRYRKYGYHGSQLSKATLLLACQELTDGDDRCHYFPAYELLMDELRDYRFYADDMLHPSEQAVRYVFERFADTYFGADTQAFLHEWRPLKAALAHRPFNPESDEYKHFMDKTMLSIKALSEKYPNFALL